VSRLAQRAVSLIEDGFLHEANIQQLAEHMGISERHLRRVFQMEFGVNLIGFAQTQRLLLAKRLLTETTLSITEVALSAGFASLRRFNALFKQRYGFNPSYFRQTMPIIDTACSLVFMLSYRPPLDWQTLVEFMGERAIPGVECMDNGIYRRTVNLYYQGQWHRGWITAELLPNASAVKVNLASELVKVIGPVLGRLKQLFDLNCHPEEIAMGLGSLAEKRPGLRVPGAFDGFEMAVRAILGQQISVKAARTLAGRFANYFGQLQKTPFLALTHVFPNATRIAVATIEEMTALGITRSRAKSIIALAQAIANDQLTLAPNVDVPATLAQLLSLPGIGEWTAQYIAMRALAWPDAFPAADLGIMKALGIASPQQTKVYAEVWRPWRSYAVMHLWLSLTEQKS
jgi:AraC family transcriptional regulator of adaptative response / DNA-3-methyladenine glycosylase II